MVVNEYLSWQRRRSRTAPYDDVVELVDRRGASPDHGGTHAERDALVAEIARLPRRQRAAIVLRYYEWLSDDEIAQVLDCRPGTVRSSVPRGLAALRITLAAREA